jgi:predicted MFS family arabinose efflux permease
MATAGEDWRAVRRARVGVTAAFVAHAVLSGLLGPWIPRIKAQTGLDASGLGIALTGFAVGLLAGTRLADPAVRRWGGRRVVRGGIPAMGVGFALLPLAGSLVSLTLLFLGIGLLAGLIDVAMNIEAVAVERRFERRVMSAIHGTWSVALFVGAALATAGIAVGLSIRIHLPISAAMVVVVSAVLLRWLPDSEEAAEEAPVRTSDDPKVGRTSPTPVLLLCLVAGGSFLVEGIAVEWSAVFLRESVGADPSAAGLGVVAFSAGMAASRFVGDRLVARFGQPAVARVGASSAFAALGAMLIVHRLLPSVAALGIVGLSLGPVVPLAFRTAGRTRRPGHASALPLVVTAGYVGSIVGPLLVGFIADLATLRIAFLVPAVATAVSALAAGATRDR